MRLCLLHYLKITTSRIPVSPITRNFSPSSKQNMAPVKPTSQSEMTLAQQTVSFVIFSQQGGTEYITLSPLKRINDISSAPVLQVVWFHSFLSPCQYLDGIFFVQAGKVMMQILNDICSQILNPKRCGEDHRPDQIDGARVSWVALKMKACFLAEITGNRCILFVFSCLYHSLKCHFCGICCDHDASCEKRQSCWNRYSADDDSYFTFHSVVLSELCMKGGKKTYCCGCFQNSKTLKLADSSALRRSRSACSIHRTSTFICNIYSRLGCMCSLFARAPSGCLFNSILFLKNAIFSTSPWKTCHHLQ